MYIDRDFAQLTTATWRAVRQHWQIQSARFSVSGPNHWNKLPPDIRKVSDKPEQFAQALKTFLFPNGNDKHC